MKKEWLVLIVILVTASFFRLHNIASAPPGLYPDEAINGNDALQAMESGHYRVFYPDNNGREGLFINLESYSLNLFGNHPWALRIVSAIIGILTVLGLYLLARILFNWQIAALSGFLMAISFWHVLFSRIGFRAIMAPFFLVWAFYFLWLGLKSGKLWPFVISGAAWGLGFYTYIAFRIMPLVLLLVLANYWLSVKKDFQRDKYVKTIYQAGKGLVLLMLVALIVSLPIGYYFFTHQQDFLGRTQQISVFSSDNLIKSLAVNSVKTLAMFNFVGDGNWRHNLSGQAMLFWPVGVLFFAGLVRSFIKASKIYKKDGHFSTVQVLLISWFFIGLSPVIISNEGLPHALRAIIVVPAVFIFAGEGLWWLYTVVRSWYWQRERQNFSFLGHVAKESSFVAIFTLLVFLSAVTIFEYNKYFNGWAKNPNVAEAFNQNYVDIGNRLNDMPKNQKKYVLVNASGVLVNGIPMPAQTVMFITDTASPEKQKAKNIYYLTEQDFKTGNYDKKGIIIPIEEKQ